MDWKTLDGLIQEFESSSPSRLIFHIVDWSRVWGLAKQVREGFQNVSYPTAKQRQDAWERFSRARDEANRLSQEERDKRCIKSEWHRKIIIAQAESARPNSLFGFMPPDRDEMKALGGVLREAGRLLSEHKTEMLGEHKKECFERIKEIQDIHTCWWDEYKKHAAERHDAWKSRAKLNLQKNLERYNKTADALDRTRRHADDLRYKISTARTAEWASKAEGWLSEAEDLIRDMEASLDQIQSWIDEDRKKLNE